MFQRAYKVRLYPNRQQEVLLGKTFGCCRKVYNCMLEVRKKSYEATGTQCRSKPSDFYGKFPFLKEVDSNALTAEVLTLNAAFKNFFERKDDGVGFPQFKAKHRDRDSYTSYTTKDNIRVAGRKLRLPKVGFVSFRNYGDIDWSVRDIKHVTVNRSRAGRYYASILVEEAVPKALPTTKAEVGIDLGLTEFCVTSDGEVVTNPRFLKEAEGRIATLQRAFARKQKGSNRHEAMRLRIAREHEKVANRRKDFLDRLSTRLLRENQTVAVEDLDVREVAEGDHAKSEHDTAWGIFLNRLQYKADWYGRTIIRVGRWFPSSQLCSVCNYRNPLVKDLTVRSWTCPQCGTSHDRDFNAAINILTEGKRLIAAGTAVQGAGVPRGEREAAAL